MASPTRRLMGSSVPADTNYKNEIDRFAPAGELCMQANPEKLEQVVESMVAKDVAWSPTLSIYEASRDVIRGAESPLVRRLPAPVHGSVLEAEPAESRLLPHRLDQHASGTLAARLPHLDGCSAPFRHQRWTHHDRRRCRLHLFAAWVRHDSRAGAPGGGGVPPARGTQARDGQRRDTAGDE